MIRTQEEFAARFIFASPGEALELLEQDSSGELGRTYKAFIERHGHRCIREAELHEKPWEENPVLLVQMLQTLVRSGGRVHPKESPDKKAREILSELKPLQRIMIRSFLKNARRSVARREITKSASIKVLHRIRKAYGSTRNVLSGKVSWTMLIKCTILPTKKSEP